MRSKRAYSRRKESVVEGSLFGPGGLVEAFLFGIGWVFLGTLAFGLFMLVAITPISLILALASVFVAAYLMKGDAAFGEYLRRVVVSSAKAILLLLLCAIPVVLLIPWCFPELFPAFVKVPLYLLSVLASGGAAFWIFTLLRSLLRRIQDSRSRIGLEDRLQGQKIGWKCPTCGAILGRSPSPPGSPFGRISGVVRCAGCQNAVSAQDVYSGRYDVDSQAGTGGAGKRGK